MNFLEFIGPYFIPWTWSILGKYFTDLQDWVFCCCRNVQVEHVRGPCCSTVPPPLTSVCCSTVWPRVDVSPLCVVLRHVSGTSDIQYCYVLLINRPPPLSYFPLEINLEISWLSVLLVLMWFIFFPLTYFCLHIWMFQRHMKLGLVFLSNLTVSAFHLFLFPCAGAEPMALYQHSATELIPDPLFSSGGIWIASSRCLVPSSYY